MNNLNLKTGTELYHVVRDINGEYKCEYVFTNFQGAKLFVDTHFEHHYFIVKSVIEKIYDNRG